MKKILLAEMLRLLVYAICGVLLGITAGLLLEKNIWNCAVGMAVGVPLGRLLYIAGATLCFWAEDLESEARSAEFKATLEKAGYPLAVRDRQSKGAEA